MKQAYAKEQLFGEGNPLFKKYLVEGDNPSTYIPAT